MVAPIFFSFKILLEAYLNQVLPVYPNGRGRACGEGLRYWKGNGTACDLPSASKPQWDSLEFWKGTKITSNKETFYFPAPQPPILVVMEMWGLRKKLLKTSRDYLKRMQTSLCNPPLTVHSTHCHSWQQCGSQQDGSYRLHANMTGPSSQNHRSKMLCWVSLI